MHSKQNKKKTTPAYSTKYMSVQSLRGSTEISLAFERILWEMDSQEAASDAHICLEQKEMGLLCVSKGMKI